MVESNTKTKLKLIDQINQNWQSIVQPSPQVSNESRLIEI